jgi:hypothetical protein
MTSNESIPQVWDDERDGQFFRITSGLFDIDYCYGAGVLLASYDPEDEFASDIKPQPTATPCIPTPSRVGPLADTTANNTN